jgi:sec-independent protein translocase protein TatC
MFVAFGVAFEVPVAVIILARLSVVTIAQLARLPPLLLGRAAAVAGIVTPPDPVSMLALLVPMGLLVRARHLGCADLHPHDAAPEDAADEAKADDAKAGH